VEAAVTREPDDISDELARLERRIAADMYMVDLARAGGGPNALRVVDDLQRRIRGTASLLDALRARLEETAEPPARKRKRRKQSTQEEVSAP
jgi:hypothetical protein